MKYLISAAELYVQLHAVQIIEIGVKTADKNHAAKALQQFLNGHIIGARYVDLNRQFCNLNTSLHYQCPNATEFYASLKYLGLDFSQPIVIYDRANHIWAARLFWILHAYGHQNVRVLHGGWTAWYQAQYPQQTGKMPSFNQFKEFSFQLKSGFFADLKQVQQATKLSSATQLINVLRRSVFLGEELRYARAGHIPNSLSLPFDQLLNENGQFKMLEENFFTALGIDLNKEIIVYCGSGITASGTALIFLSAQAIAVKVYDGSMSEWSANPNLPLTVWV
ncbi:MULTISPECIES: sulfurtransferase [unclassified Acinetobacter]|uniref:sulfurtransferase n=1 Tax=unclassified Acinetobacter TaxID=196816 RepID=UPI002934F8FE|nr:MULTISPECIES: rhodanese-like domain-containing protein [unclassified Acinetobacter]WOE32470.1 rhodanese-like domain-containing protein [Acinetobacter sp. SAAs470]WOE37946.1 rhodanese-like domain-containing protein [Acinetobacter sp. SAAs474]